MPDKCPWCRAALELISIDMREWSCGTKQDRSLPVDVGQTATRSEKCKAKCDRSEEALASKHELHEAVYEALHRSPFDISPCCGCGEPVVCLPDGLPSCVGCSKKEGE